MKITGTCCLRAWLLAALVSFGGFSCASLPDGLFGPVSEKAPELRVQVQWRIPISADVLWELDRRELGQPIISPGGDLLVGSGQGWVYRILAHSGEIVWSKEISSGVDSPATLANNIAYLGTQNAEMVALDWRNGEEIWRFQARGSLEGRPSYYEGMLFFVDSNEVLYALNVADGSLLWDYQRSAPEFFTIKGSGIPLIVGDSVYVGFADGVLVELNRATGEEQWAVYLGDESGEFGDIDLPILHDQQRLIVTSHAGGVHGIERATGAVLWRLPFDNVVGVIKEGGFLFGATATGRVFAARAADGEIFWESRLDENSVPMGISFAGPYLAVPLARGPLVWMDARSGREVLRWAPSSGFQNAPVFDERRGYILSNQGYLYGFGLAF